MANSIQTGDVVCLVSNSDHKMTVGTVSTGIAYCYWYDEKANEVKNAAIPVGALIKV